MTHQKTLPLQFERKRDAVSLLKISPTSFVTHETKRKFAISSSSLLLFRYHILIDFPLAIWAIFHLRHLSKNSSSNENPFNKYIFFQHLKELFVMNGMYILQVKLSYRYLTLSVRSLPPSQIEFVILHCRRLCLFLFRSLDVMLQGKNYQNSD